MGKKRKSKKSNTKRKRFRTKRKVSVEVFKLDPERWMHLNIWVLEHGVISCRGFLELAIRAFEGRPQTPAYEEILSASEAFHSRNSCMSAHLRIKHRLKDRYCFPNCQFSWREYPGKYAYCEGISRAPTGEFREHAWLLNHRGLVVDPTSPHMAEEYFGIKVSDEKVENWIRQNGVPSGSLHFPGFQNPYIFDVANDCWDRTEFDEYMQCIGSIDAEVAVESVLA